MLQSLSRSGILIDTLFHVEGDLVENYNRALECCIGKRTQNTSFHLDLRGESPELEEELGTNYLQAGPAHRYCIIVSPEQKHATLIHEEFSFDRELLDQLYEQFLPGISLATRVDGMYGEIDDEVREYETLEDLLFVKNIHLELRTPSKFLSKCRTLLQDVEQLKANPNLLVEDEGALPKKILGLVNELGDVRDYDLRPIELTQERENFYTRLFGGVCVFRDVEWRQKEEEHALYGLSGERITTVPDGEPDKAKSVVLYREKDYHPEDGPLVTFIPFHDKARVIDFLLSARYAEYAYELLEPALSRMEDETLLSKGHDVMELNRQRRLQALSQYRDAMLPAWSELKNLKRQVSKGHAFTEVIQECSPDVRSMLLSPVPDGPGTVNVVEHTLTRLCDYLYEKMLRHNRRYLEGLFANADRHKQRYILKVLS